MRIHLIKKTDGQPEFDRLGYVKGVCGLFVPPQDSAHSPKNVTCKRCRAKVKKERGNLNG